MKKIITGSFLVLFVHLFFCAIISIKDVGEIRGNVSLLTESVVVFKDPSGNAQNVPVQSINYILFEESKSELIGNVQGIVLKNGVSIYGESFSILEDSGNIQTPFGIVQVNLKNLAFFSTMDLQKYKQSFQPRKSLIPTITSATDENTYFHVGNIPICVINRDVTTGDPKIYKLYDGIATYYVYSEYVDKIEIPSKVSVGYNFLLTLKNGYRILCNVKLENDKVLAFPPFFEPLFFEINEIKSLECLDNASTKRSDTQKDYAILGDVFFDEVIFDEKTHSVILKIVAENITLMGKMAEKEIQIIPIKSK